MLCVFIFLIAIEFELSIGGDEVLPEQIKYIPKDFCVRLTTNSTAVIQWFEPVSLRDEIMGYTIYHTLDPDLPLNQWNYSITGNYPLATLRNIELGQMYTFRIRLNALNFEEPGPLSDHYTVEMINKTRSCYDQRKTSIIRSLNILRAAATSYSSVEVWWNVPYDPYIHTGFCVTYGISGSHYWQNLTVGLVQGVEIRNLQQAAVYIISLAFIGKAGLDHIVQEVTVKVQPEEVPCDIIVYDVTPYSLTLKWSPPTRFHPILYKIIYDASKQYVDDIGNIQQVQLPQIEQFVDGHITDYYIKELIPNTEYIINITAIPVDHSYRPSSRTKAFTRMAAPHQLVKPALLGTVKGGNVQVSLPKASEEFGPIGHYYVVVTPETEESMKVPPDSYSLEDLLEYTKDNGNETVPYIAAKFTQKIPYGFILGNGEKYGGHTNRKLDQAMKYRMFVRAVVEAPLEELFTDTPYSDTFYLNMSDIKRQNAI